MNHPNGSYLSSCHGRQIPHIADHGPGSHHHRQIGHYGVTGTGTLNRIFKHQQNVGWSVVSVIGRKIFEGKELQGSKFCMRKWV